MSSEEERNELIIMLVQGFPQLYDKKDASYKDSKKKENSWVTIAEMTNMSVDDCQIRWKSLRDRYCWEKKKLDAPSGSGAIYQSENSKQLLKRMSFLDAIVRHSKTAGNYSGSSIEATTPVVGDNPISGSDAYIRCVTSPQPSTSAVQDPSPTLHHRTSWGNTKPQAMRVSPPMSSPVTIPSPSPSPRESTQLIVSPINRIRTMSYSESVESDSGSGSYIDPFIDESELEMSNERSSSSLSTIGTEKNSKTPRLKRARTEDINTALIDALSSLKSMRKTDRFEAPQADKLFADSVVAELQRFPPQKRTLIKGEIILLISKYDEIDE